MDYITQKMYDEYVDWAETEEQMNQSTLEEYIEVTEHRTITQSDEDEQISTTEDGI